MKEFIFVSDFDGTLSNKDFYWMIIDEYMIEEGNKLYKHWREGNLKDHEFLSTIFQSPNLTEQELDAFISKIPLDEGAIELLRKVKAANGDFAILSAGSDYYIKKLLEQRGINDIPVYSNKGIYSEGGIKLILDEESPFHSEHYGIDKSKVIQHFKRDYQTIYFAGDSAPDVSPSKIADIVFAKNQLQDLLKHENIPFIPIDSFNEIQTYMENKGVI